MGVGPNGTYAYHYAYNYYGTDYDYYYRVYQDPYQYGGVSTDLGVFVDDSITVNDRLTLNLGVRFDHNTGSIPDYERLTIGEPSISPSGNFAETDETIPGVTNLINWKLVSPRVGFAFQPTGERPIRDPGLLRCLLRPERHRQLGCPATGIPHPVGLLVGPGDHGARLPGLGVDRRTRSGSTRTSRRLGRLQYAIGFEQQLSDDVSIGTQYVYKTTKDLVGWEILGGVYEPFPFTDPFTGTQYTLLNAVEPYTFRKGNDPGDFPGSEGHGLLPEVPRRDPDLRKAVRRPLGPERLLHLVALRRPDPAHARSRAVQSLLRKHGRS